MDQHKNSTYLLIGTATKDLQADNSYTIGGTVTYATVVVKKLGWRPVVITAVEPTFEPIPYLRDVTWKILPSPKTTTFRNEYDEHGNRHQTIGPIGRAIAASEISDDCRQATIVHLCPLAQELKPNIAGIFDSALLGATPQGWMRRWDEQGRVSLGDWYGAEEVLPRLNVAVISIEDVEGNWSIAENWAAQTETLIVTEGELGCTIFNRGNRISVPPRPAHPIDPTGAGDVFAAAFFIRYYETGNLWESARFANVVASMAIERPGPEGAPERHEIEAYMAMHPIEPA
ncbi:MAG: PfkB family carbohydrate kinase [Anaerolineae bacterium]